MKSFNFWAWATVATVLYVVRDITVEIIKAKKEN